ncbi:MAG: PAS domain S-box protein [Methylophilaceae bacterium]
MAPLSIHTQDQLFESAFNYAAIGIALVGLNGRWLKTNPALSQIVGYTETELLKVDFQTLTHPEDLHADLQHVKDLLDGKGLSYQMEKRYIHKNGAIIWVLLSVSLVSKPDGSPEFFISQIQDITKRKAAEAERDAFFSQSVDLLAIANKQGFLIEVNPAWTRVLGWSQKELTSKSFMDFIHPDDVERTLAEAKRVSEGGEPTPCFCNRYITRDGSYRWLEWNTSESSFDRLYCSVRDVTDRVEADDALKQSEIKFQDVVANVPGIVYQFEWHAAGKSRFTYVSPKVFEILGLTPESLLQDVRHISNLIHPDDLAGYQQNLEQSSKDLSYRYWEGRHILHDGRTVWTSLSAMPRALSNGGVFWTGLLQDITPQKILNQKVVESENLYRSLVTSLSEGVILSASNGDILACNQSAQKILGLSEEQILSRTIADPNWKIIREDGKPLPLEERPANIAIRKGKSVKNLVLGFDTPNQGLRWISFSAEPLWKDDENIPYAAVSSFFDVTDIKELNAKLERQAHMDFLTGAYNRGYFYELASFEFARAQRYKTEFSLMMLDIDHFKTINDQYGHDVGDTALKEFVVVVKETLRDMDVVGRFGGEEFVVLLPETNKQNAVKIAERIRMLISNKAITASNGQTFNMTVSIGVSQFNADIESLDALIKLTDNALYNAKETGRNKVIYQ